MKIEAIEEFDENHDPFMPIVTNVRSLQPKNKSLKSVWVNSLGQNTVTVKGNQMIVSGPDFDEAQVIAKQLSSGVSRLATLNGRQVLISFSSTMVNVNQQQQQEQLQQQTAQKSQK